MSEELERVFRNRQLTPEEVARDEDIRRRVEEEFPPVKRTFPSGSIRELLKQAIRASGRSVAEISMDAGVSQIVVSRFLSGDSDIHVATADKLAEALGLKLAAGS